MSAIQINIKRQLSEQNMSAAELERRTGIPHAVVNILHGRSKNPSLRTAQAIAKELGCTVEDLLSENDECIDTGDWNPRIYKKSFEAIFNAVLKAKVQPEPKVLSDCINEVYNYTIGSPTKVVDQRFVDWLLKKNFSINT